MGRFKIYDPKNLVSIENDSNYCKCLLCEKKLKNIMGNIKRHYEQMHSLYVDANTRNTKKCKRKSSKLKRLNKNTFNEVEKLGATSIQKMDTIKPFQNPHTSANTNNNLNLNSVNNLPKVSQQKVQTIEPSAVTQQLHEISSLPLNPQKSNSAISPACSNNDGRNRISNNQSVHKVSSYHHSNTKKAILIEENDQIQVPCYSFINNIQINSVESCQQLEFLKCLVETKAHVNIPLKAFQHEDTFQNALKNWKPNFQYNYSPVTIGEHIDRMTKKLHQEIKKLAANRIIYLKLDIASSTEGNIMLMNIQFIKDFHFQVITLNAIELSDDDLASYLKKKVMSTLERFRIEISNVFAIIKDNTNNVRKYLKNSGEMCEFPSNTEYCQHMSHGFPGHAIHFAASDIITQFNENINQSRDSARKLQNQMLRLKIKSTMLLDNNTNWFSVYDMIESLMSLHDDIIEDKILSLIEVDWVFVKKFVESFKPIVETALMLQSNEIFIMGDFYREWLLCEMELEELSEKNELAIYLLKALSKRKLEFFENSSFLAALYMDPRYCYMGSMHLSDKQKEMAILQLMGIFNKLKAMQENTTLPFPANKLKSVLNDRYDKLERQVVNNVETNIDTTTNYDADSLRHIDELRVKELLEQLQFEERFFFKTNILEYWSVAKYKNPLLAKIAEVALAAPATQATLSRAINDSSTTLLKRKLTENKENIDNLLMLKLNQDLVDKISLEN